MSQTGRPPRRSGITTRPAIVSAPRASRSPPRPGATQRRRQGPARREAEAVPDEGLALEAAPLEIGEGAGLAEQPLVVVRNGDGEAGPRRRVGRRGEAHDRPEIPGARRDTGPISRARRERRPQPLERQGEGDPVHAPDEVQGVAVRAAAEAVEVVVARVDEQAGLAVVVERAPAHQDPAARAKRHAVPGDQVRQRVGPFDGREAERWRGVAGAHAARASMPPGNASRRLDERDPVPPAPRLRRQRVRYSNRRGRVTAT